VIANAPIFAAVPLASVEVLFVVLLLAGVTAISAILFVFWVFWAVLRLLADGMNRLLAGPRKAILPKRSDPFLACPDPICRGINPAAAHFCRQCGRSLDRSPHAPAPLSA
jgi:hypothetical protein